MVLPSLNACHSTLRSGSVIRSRLGILYLNVIHFWNGLYMTLSKTRVKLYAWPEHWWLVIKR